jgi:hypothetical protein
MPTTHYRKKTRPEAGERGVSDRPTIASRRRSWRVKLISEYVWTHGSRRNLRIRYALNLFRHQSTWLAMVAGQLIQITYCRVQIESELLTLWRAHALNKFSKFAHVA